jgi:hypothetical protein
VPAQLGFAGLLHNRKRGQPQISLDRGSKIEMLNPFL